MRRTNLTSTGLSIIRSTRGEAIYTWSKVKSWIAFFTTIKPFEDTYNPIKNLPRIKVLRYFKRKKLDMPEDIGEADNG